MMLLFNQRKLPRTMTRVEWHEVDRWRRVTQQKLREHRDRMTALVRAFPMSDHRRGELVDRLVNPPVLLGPYQ